MTIDELHEAVRACAADTLIAAAFRRAVGLTPYRARGKATAKVDRYAGASGLMRQRYGVRM